MCYVCYVAFELLVSGTKLLSQALVWYSIVVMLYVDFKVIHMIIMCYSMEPVAVTLIFFYFRRKVEAFTNHNILK